MDAQADSVRLDKEQRIVCAAISAVLLSAVEVAVDWGTWVELNVSVVYGLPLVLAALARSIRLLWGLMAVLVSMTFLVYAAQIPDGEFAFREPLFVNRVLSAVALVITTCLLHIRLLAAAKLAAQDEAIKETNRRLELANNELVRHEIQITRQNEELELRRREAEATSERKTRFMASVSHDIRAPINAINLMAEVMCRTAENPAFAAEVPDIARRLQVNALSLSDLLSDVLDIARFDSGCVELKPSRFLLNDLLNEHREALLLLAQSKGLSLVVESSNSPIWLYVDRVKLSRVVSNLLSNAIKYTAAGDVTARVVVSPDQAVSIEVQDTGLGIPPNSLDGIFDEFAQLSNPERDPNKGWGLGLPICKRLVNFLGGAISVVSQEGAGSVFTIRLGSECLCDPPGEDRRESRGHSDYGCEQHVHKMTFLSVRQEF